VIWKFPESVNVSSELAQAVGGPPLVAEILTRRGIHTGQEARAFLDPDAYTPAPPTEMPDVETAAGHLLEAIRAGKQILVWGDFDVDGQTATALLVDALRGLDANVTYHVPNRMKHGHGIALPVLEEHLTRGFDVLLTCDTGIAAHEAIRRARKTGVTTLITDHHALPPGLPEADAVVNPQRLPPGHPLRDLPGVGVAYKLAEHLYTLMGRGGEERRFRDLAALGIVADVAAQKGDTRHLLQLGLDALRRPQRVGLQELMRAAQVDILNLSADTIGFQLGPRLNALGRLDDATLAVELLTSDDKKQAAQIAQQLELLNNRRKQIEDQIYAAAQEQIARDPLLLEHDALVLAGERWHSGVIGIVASRLVEQYQRPVVLLVAPPEQTARGSARSIPGVDIGAAFTACEDLLLSHGGHPGAAGCSLESDLIPQFRRRLSQVVREIRDPSVETGLRIDAVLPLGKVTMELVKEIDRLSPFGAGNPPVHLMSSGLRAAADAPIGLKKQHRKLQVVDETGAEHAVIWWRGVESPGPQGVFDLVYIPRINDYRGAPTLQLEWVDSRPTPGIEIEIVTPAEVIDLRSRAEPLNAVPPEALIWAEALSDEELPFDKERLVDRFKSRACKDLVIWTAPPGQKELVQMIELSGARRFYVVGRHLPSVTAEGFLKRLGGLAKYAHTYYPDGVSLRQLARATAQREVTVRRGLEWLAVRGQITLEWVDSEYIRINTGGEHDEMAVDEIQDSLRALLEETKAFRAHFTKTTELDSLFRELVK
jgi:single-stranded-DNA-specific exonuclease